KPICTGAATDPSYCRQECASVATDSAAAVPANCTARLDMLRDTLVEGLKLRAQYNGVNPYKLGLVGSSDTHNGDPGNVREDSFRGHGGVLDDSPDVLLGSWVCADGSTTRATTARVFNQKAFRLNPGGLTGIWAEENTRASLFGALKRREVYATSGPRIAVRLYASWGAIRRRARAGWCRWAAIWPRRRPAAKCRSWWCARSPIPSWERRSSASRSSKAGSTPPARRTPRCSRSPAPRPAPRPPPTARSPRPRSPSSSAARGAIPSSTPGRARSTTRACSRTRRAAGARGRA